MVTVDDVPSVRRAWSHALAMLRINTLDAQRRFMKSVECLGLVAAPQTYEIQQYFGLIDHAVRTYVHFLATTDLADTPIRQRNARVRQRESELLDMIESLEHLVYKFQRPSVATPVLEWTQALRDALGRPR